MKAMNRAEYTFELLKANLWEKSEVWKGCDFSNLFYFFSFDYLFFYALFNTYNLPDNFWYHDHRKQVFIGRFLSRNIFDVLFRQKRSGTVSSIDKVPKRFPPGPLENTKRTIVLLFSSIVSVKYYITVWKIQFFDTLSLVGAIHYLVPSQFCYL